MASSVGPAAKWVTKTAVKYGPHAVALAKTVGPTVVDQAKEQQERLRNKRHAFEKAAAVTNGSVLRMRHGDDLVWVVYSADDPVAVFPQVDAPLRDVVANADLSQRVTPAQREEARLRRRAGRAADRGRARLRRSPHVRPEVAPEIDE